MDSKSIKGIHSVLSKIFPWYYEEEIRETYYQELNYQCKSGLLPAGIVAFIAPFRYLTLDRALHPEIQELFYFRVVIIAFGLLTILLAFSKIARKHAMIVWLVLANIALTSISFTTAIVGAEPVYMGSFIFAFTLFVVAPFPLSITYSMMFANLVVFGVCLEVLEIDFKSVEKSFSLSTFRNTVLVNVIFVFIIDRIRRKRFNRSRQIEKQRDSLQKLMTHQEKQFQIGMKIQQSLLPTKLPQVNSIAMSYYYSPVESLGGDFFDVLLESDKLGIFVCDVSGHGVPAALLASMVKMSLHDWTKYLKKPSELADSIYKSLKGKLSGNFLSASIIYIDTKSGKMVYSSAGHLPIILVKKNGTLISLHTKGRVICETFSPNVEEKKIRLEAGDKLLIYTDGITEAKNPEGELFQEENLHKVIIANSKKSLKELKEKIIEELNSWAGTREIHDDITLFLAEVR